MSTTFTACEHGLSLDLCAGPGHYPAEGSDYHLELDRGPRLWDASPDVCCAAFQLGACAHTESYDPYDYDTEYDEAMAEHGAIMATVISSEEPF